MTMWMGEFRLCPRVLVLSLASVLACADASAAVQVIGTQYQEDQMFPEFDCFWNASGFPNSCASNRPGATVHVYLKNTGASSVTINDATLGGHSLNTIIKTSAAGWNVEQFSSIYLYWDFPPQDILDAGEPVWWRADPPTIPAGGVAQVAVRLRTVPTNWISLGIVSSAGTVTTNIMVDANAPRVASLGYSEDLRKVYVHWRRSVPGGSGAAPTSVWLDGTNVTALTTTVSDPNLNFAASVISLPNPLPFFSYHVFQGVYPDGKTATTSQRAWTNKFIYGTFGTFPKDDTYTAADWLDEAADHGFNSVQYNLGEMSGYMGTSAGRTHMQARGYGYTILDPGNANALDPDMWFLYDEPDVTEAIQLPNVCGTGNRLPCDSSLWSGTLAMREIAHGQDLRNVRANVPTVINLDGSLEPESFYTWGPAVDILQSDNYYEVRLRDSYWFYPNRIPLFKQPKVSYAVSRTASAAAEPNPFNHLLYSVKWRCGNVNNCGVHYDELWPYPTPASKRMEAYYSLAGGAKGMGYWWFKGGNPSFGLVKTAECAPLWKEMGLVGNEIRTARNLIVKSTPVDLPLASGSNVWARVLASGTDTLMLYVVNDNYYNDQAGCHYTPVSNATVTLTLPLWMQNAPGAFEITAGGLRDVNTQLNGSQLQVNLGTLKWTRMIILTTDAQLRTAVQQRYDQSVRPAICNFAPEHCTNTPPSITQQPVNRSIATGAMTTFTVVASGSGTLSHRWQKNNSNLANGGHYSGVTTGNLTITGADTNDVASYRCIVTNAYGSITSTPAILSLFTVGTCLETVNPDFESGFALIGGGYLATNWTEWEAEPGVIIGYDETTIVRGGDHSQRLRVWGGTNGTSGGVYQRVPVVPGQTFSAGVWTYAGDGQTFCYLGVDPAGGTDPDTGVIWSSANTNAAWVQKTLAGIATASNITLFLKVVSTDNSKRNGYFDDAISPECLDQPPGIIQPPASQNVIAGGTASFTVAAEGSPPLRYQWQRNNSNLGNSGHYSGCTTPTLTIIGADNNDVASYRCVVTNDFGSTNSPSATLTVTAPNPCLGVLNADFETGFTLAGGGYIANHWIEWETDPNVVVGYDETGTVHGGAHAQRIRVWGGTNGSSGGIYQRVPVTAGQAYAISVWMSAGDNLTTCSVGVHPAGGTNAAGGVTWSAGTTNVTWTQQTVTGMAAANLITVFYKVASADNVKRDGYFDDALPASSSTPPRLIAQGSADTLTLTWPECPAAHLERVGSLTPPVIWSPVTNQPSVMGGQNRVTITLAGDASYFRLRIQ